MFVSAPPGVRYSKQIGFLMRLEEYSEGARLNLRARPYSAADDVRRDSKWAHPPILQTMDCQVSSCLVEEVSTVRWGEVNASANRGSGTGISDTLPHVQVGLRDYLALHFAFKAIARSKTTGSENCFCTCQHALPATLKSPGSSRPTATTMRILYRPTIAHKCDKRPSTTLR
jgi:hypothetical protein